MCKRFIHCFIVGIVFAVLTLGAVHNSEAADTEHLDTAEACRNIPDAELSSKLFELTSRAQLSELTGFNYDELVERHWNQLQLSATLRREIDRVVESVRADTSVLDRLYAVASTEASQKLVSNIVSRVYNSEGFIKSINNLATEAEKEVDARIAKGTDSFSDPAIACLLGNMQARPGPVEVKELAVALKARSTDVLKVPPVTVRPGTPGETAFHGRIDFLTAANVAGATAPIIHNISTKIAILTAAETKSLLIQWMAKKILRNRLLKWCFAGIALAFIGAMVARFWISTAAVLPVMVLGMNLYYITNDIATLEKEVFVIVADQIKSDSSETLVKKEISMSIEADVKRRMNESAVKVADALYKLKGDNERYRRNLLYVVLSSIVVTVTALVGCVWYIRLHTMRNVNEKTC